MLHYSDIKDKISRGCGRVNGVKSCKLSRNVSARIEDGNMIFRLYATDIVTITAHNTHILNSGGHRTHLTHVLKEFFRCNP